MFTKRSLVAAAAVLAASFFAGGTNAQVSRDRNDRSLTVYNNSSFQSVISIHARPSGTAPPRRSDPDLLGSAIIGPRGSYQIYVDNGRGVCVYDILFTTDANRPDWRMNNVNVCRESAVSVSD